MKTLWGRQNWLDYINWQHAERETAAKINDTSSNMVSGPPTTGRQLNPAAIRLAHKYSCPRMAFGDDRVGNVSSHLVLS